MARSLRITNRKKYRTRVTVVVLVLCTALLGMAASAPAEYPEPNPLKQKIAQGKAVSGLFIQTPGADCIEIAADVGFDFVIIDEEHGNFGFSETIDMIRFSEAAGICPIVRVSSHDGEHIRKVMEAGAMGICVPRVQTAEQAQAVVAAAKYAYRGNGGTKGACPNNRAARSRGGDWENYVRWSNDNVTITLLIESQRGLENLKQILQVDGIDCISLGPFDLKHEMGFFGPEAGQKEMREIIVRFKEAMDEAQVPYFATLSTFDLEKGKAEYEALVAQGARYFILGSDRTLLEYSYRAVLRPTGVE